MDQMDQEVPPCQLDPRLLSLPAVQGSLLTLQVQWVLEVRGLLCLLVARWDLGVLLTQLGRQTQWIPSDPQCLAFQSVLVVPCCRVDLLIHRIPSARAYQQLLVVPVFLLLLAFQVHQVFQGAQPCQTLPLVQTLLELPWIPSVLSFRAAQAPRDPQRVQGCPAVPFLQSVLGLP